MSVEKGDKSNSFAVPPRRSDLRRRRYQMLSLWYGDERAVNEISAHTCQPRRIGTLLDLELQKINRPDNGHLIRINSEWEKIIGSSFARFCKPVALRDGVLSLKVRHSALLVELKPSCDLIKKRINTVLNSEVCREIRLCI